MNILLSVDRLWVWAANNGLSPGSGVGHSSGAGSPFDGYSARVAIAMFLVSILVSVLLIGAFLVLNLGLMSKRPEDRVGERSPSDLGILKSNTWPEAPYEQNVLPAQDEGSTDQLTEVRPASKRVA